MAPSFEEYRKNVFDQQKEQNNMDFIEGIKKVQKEIYELPYADTTVEKVIKLLKQKKVSEGSRNKLRTINSFLAEQAMKWWTLRHRSRQRDRLGLSELNRGTPLMDRLVYYIQGFL